MRRYSEYKIMLLANWDNYFLRMQNPEAQLPRIKKNCPTLYVVLMDEDKDDVIQLRHKNEKAFESGLGVICKVDGDTPILALRDKPILDKVTTRLSISTTNSTPILHSPHGKRD